MLVAVMAWNWVALMDAHLVDKKDVKTEDCSADSKGNQLAVRLVLTTADLMVDL